MVTSRAASGSSWGAGSARAICQPPIFLRHARSGVEQSAARWAHYPKVTGSIPVPATAQGLDPPAQHSPKGRIAENFAFTIFTPTFAAGSGSANPTEGE